MKFLNEVDVADKKVLLRTDFNVALDDEGNVEDDTKLRASLPTIQYLLEQGVKQVIMVAHLGRPKGQVIEKLKMNKVAKALSDLLGKDVLKLDDCVDIPVPEHAKLVLLENVRFHVEEKKKDEVFAKKLANHADLYVCDGFGSMHDEDVSVTMVARYLPACAGFLVKTELEHLALDKQEKPIVAILGGAKISTKFDLVRALLEKVDKLILGGAMIFTFYKAQGWEIGKSLYEEDQVDKARFLLNNEKILLPVDVVVAPSADAEDQATMVPANKMPADSVGLDVGSETLEEIQQKLASAKTVFWNGPLGYFEKEAFARGTQKLVHLLEASPAVTLAGGGETDEAIKRFGDKSKFTHVSTGGGASMTLLSGKEMPGITALDENEKLFFKN